MAMTKTYIGKVKLRRAHALIFEQFVNHGMLFFCFSRKSNKIIAENPPLNLLHDTVYALERTFDSFAEETIPGAFLIAFLSFV